MTGATKFKENSERTFQIKCSSCGKSIGFITTKYYIGNIKIECVKCFAEKLTE